MKFVPVVLLSPASVVSLLSQPSSTADITSLHNPSIRLLI